MCCVLLKLLKCTFWIISFSVIGFRPRKAMACACGHLLRALSTVPLSRQPIRNVVIFRRMYKPKLYKLHQTGPFRPKLKRRQYVYIMEENTNNKPAGKMDVILATDVEGLGFKGDIVTVEKRLARNYMFPSGVADYICPENLIKYEPIVKENEDKIRQSLTGHQTLKKLTGMTLPIGMSPSVPWELNKTHVKVAFRNCGVILSEECIELPEKPVSQATETTVQVKINKLDTVSVKAIVYHYNKSVAPVLPPVWSDVDSTKFDINEAIADAAHKLHNLKLMQ